MWTDWQKQTQQLLLKQPGRDAREICGYLNRLGHKLSRHDVNSFLYSSRQDFRRTDGPARPTWFLKEGANSDRPRVAPPADPWSSRLDLYPWQQRALRAWLQHDGRGVIEAVTGTGKTRLAVAAIEMQLRQGGRAAVLVHTKELLHQWKVQLEKVLGDCGVADEIGVMGAGRADDLTTHRVVVAMAHSCIKRYLAPPTSWHAYLPNLLVADEVHHYAADQWRRGLEETFKRRLGLTATYERDDGGIEDVLDPYFGGVAMSVDYEEALSDGVIADFKVAFIGVPFTPQEASDYDDATDRMSRYRGKLIHEWGIPADPQGEFFARVGKLAATKDGPGARLAGLYLSSMTKRRGILAASAWKREKLRALSPAIRAADRTILFTQTREAAEEAVSGLRSVGIRGAVLDGSMNVDDRADVFAGFEDGQHELIAAPQLFDEGVDVPSADLALVLASSRSRRQMVQRMGRVLRKKRDGRLARIAVLYVAGTFEDPEQGAHETFLASVARAAAEVEDFRPGALDVDICEWLQDWW